MNFIIPLVVYDFDIMFSFGESNKDLRKKLKGKIPKSDLDNTDIWTFTRNTERGRFVLFSNGASLIRMKILPKTTQQMATLQHEIFHAVGYILRQIGLNHNEETEEAYAYLIGYITKEVYDKIL